MSEPVEVEAKVEKTEAVASELTETQSPVEAAKPEGATPVEAPVEALAQEPAEGDLSREEFTKIADEFGAEIAVKTVRDGGDYSTALKAFADGLKGENEKQAARIKELEAELSKETPVTVTEAKTKKSVFKSGK